MSYNPTGLASYVNLHRGQESVVVPIWKSTAGEFPNPTFQTLYDVFSADPDFSAAGYFIANRGLSHGWHIECNDKLAPADKEDAEIFLTDWLDNVQWGDRRNERGFTPLLRVMIPELVWGGNTLLEMLPDENQIQRLAQVQLTSLWKAQRDDTGALTAIWQFPSINPRALTPSKYILYSWRLMNREPFGKGLLQSVVMPKPNMITGGWIPPLAATKWQMEDDARRRLHVQASPHTIFSVKGQSESANKAMAEAINNAPADARFLTNTEVGVVSDVPPGRGTFQAEFDQINNEIKSATGNVLSEMLTGKGFSYASAVKAGSLGDEIVWDMQAVISSNTESWILNPVLEQNGFDSVLLKPKFKFNAPDPFTEIQLSDLNTAFQIGAISQADYIRNAKQFGKLDLDDPLPQMMNPTMTPVAPAQAQGGNIPEPGNLIMNPAGQPSSLDPVAMQNMMQVQQAYEKARLNYKSALESMKQKLR